MSEEQLRNDMDAALKASAAAVLKIASSNQSLAEKNLALNTIAQNIMSLAIATIAPVPASICGHALKSPLGDNYHLMLYAELKEDIDVSSLVEGFATAMKPFLREREGGALKVVPGAPSLKDFEEV